jgi:uracil-DNA glycosylase
VSTFAGLVHPSWLPALSPLEDVLSAIEDFLSTEISLGREYHPSQNSIFNAFSVPLDDVRVLIMGQDPYPTPGHAMGLSFSVQPHVVPFPKSLNNIFEELSNDLGCDKPQTGDLTPWKDQGVMLLNRVLTVRSGEAGSHRNIGWQSITDAVIGALTSRDKPLVAILWGNDAQAVAPLLGDTPVVAAAHPSPLSAYRGFLGSKPFSKTNSLLNAQGDPGINWCLP